MRKNGWKCADSQVFKFLKKTREQQTILNRYSVMLRVLGTISAHHFGPE